MSCAVGGLINAAITGARTGNSVGALASQETKARLLRQITEEGWDPYSADMTVEEFYALMELVEEGALPLDSSDTRAISAYSALGIAASDAGVPKAAADSGIFIPRTMFLLNGLENYAGDNPPAEDPDGTGYKLPPGDWDGVGVTTDQDTGALRAAVLVKGINDSNPNVAGDVNQDLFPKYDGYYVRRVTAEGVEVSILGVIDKGDGNYVYYYMSSEDQSTLVSSTTLPDGAKFIVNYSINEHEITYEIEMSDGSNVPANITLDSVFGATRPTKTVDAAYSFDIIAPYGYTARVFRETNGNRVELTGTELPEENRVNNGYPLGAEPVYTIQNGKQVPDTDSGPSVMTRNATFYNDLVKEDRTVVAVLTKRDAPVFNAFNLIPNIDNTKGRGTSAFYKVKAKDRETGEEIEVLYDYEDVFEWANGRESKYDYV
ncbi:MAG: hypothetical protein J1G06_08850, partial [Oscillospiraceae bacterium]|nr:hypothetical protein [Oscillospiraceae bacterium]